MKKLLIFTALLLFPVLAQAQGRWNAAEFDIQASETTDCTPALQALLNRAGEAGGGVVELPAGRFRFDGTLAIPAGVTLQGTYRVPPTIQKKDQKPDGTVLLVYAGRGEPESAPFIRLAGDNAAVAGLIFVYPEWDQKTIPPVPYPPCIASSDTNNVAVLSCCLLNPYEGIRMVRAHRHLLRDITGYPVWRGLFVDQCYDIGRVENFHYWPFGVTYNPKDPYCEWINKNGVAFEFARTDWEYVYNTFCFGYGVGYKFSAYGHGAANGNFLGLGADSCRRAVLVEQSQEPGLLITNGEFVGRWSSTDSVCVEILDGNRGKVSLSNCSFWGPVETCVLSGSQTGQFTATACHFVNWDNAGQDAPAIRIAAGKAIVNGCTFQQAGTHVTVQPEARSAILSANQAEGGFQVEGANLRQTQMFANEPTPLAAMPDAERLHYTVAVGTPADSGFLRGFYAAEIGKNAAGEPTSARWTHARARITLPVVSGKKYEFKLRLRDNPFRGAKPEEAGIWLGDRQLASFARKPGENANEFQFEIPASADSELFLEIRTPGWVPARKNPRSNDTRELGVYVESFEMRAEDATSESAGI